MQHNRKIIVCAGMRRSGSTLLFNVLRFIYLLAGYRVYGAFWEETQYDFRVQADIHLIKTHKYDVSLKNLADFIFTNKRDIRDVAASGARCRIINREKPVETEQQILDFVDDVLSKEYFPWSQHSNKEVDYNEFFFYTPDGTRVSSEIIRDIAAILGVDVDPIEINRRIKEMDNTVIALQDRVTQLSPGHITSREKGNYQKTLTTTTIKEIETRYKHEPILHLFSEV